MVLVQTHQTDAMVQVRRGEGRNCDLWSSDGNKWLGGLNSVC